LEDEEAPNKRREVGSRRSSGRAGGGEADVAWSSGPQEEGRERLSGSAAGTKRGRRGFPAAKAEEAAVKAVLLQDDSDCPD
jgi:hypothetical protein